MKLKSIILVLSIAVFMFSCKNEPKTNEPKTELDIKSNTFKVTLSLLIKKNDTIHLYYTEDNTINFNEASSIWTPVSGNETVQDVTFELPKDVFPTQFRFDLGINKENEKIIVKGVKLNYLDKLSQITESSVYNYFRVNTDNTNINLTTKELSRKDPKIAAGPCLYPLEIQLKTEIDKLAK